MPATFEAKSGREQEVVNFLKGGLPMNLFAQPPDFTMLDVLAVKLP